MIKYRASCALVIKAGLESSGSFRSTNPAWIKHKEIQIHTLCLGNIMGHPLWETVFVTFNK